MIVRNVVASLLLCLSVNAQLLDRVVAPNESLTNWEQDSYLNTFHERRIIVGDFDGDNLDDLFWDEQRGGSYWRIGTLRANGDGTFSQIYSANGSPYVNGHTMLAGSQYVTGKFFGGNADLLLQYEVDRYALYSFGQGTIELERGRFKQVGDARLGIPGAGTLLVAGDFVPGVDRDVLLSFELLTGGGQLARLQSFDPATQDDFSTIWSNAGTPEYFGGWYFNTGYDLFLAADFIPGDETEELLCINRTNGWMKIMRFEHAQWVDLYANYGTYEVYPTPTFGAFTFNARTSVLVGNFDTTDANVEVVMFDPAEPLDLHVFEFDPVTRTFAAETRPAHDMTGLARRAKSPAPPVRAQEQWRTERYCTHRIFGFVCIDWRGGQKIQQERDFYTWLDQAGDLQIVAGRFYDNGWWLPSSQDLLVLANVNVYIPDIEPNTVFYTDCGSNNIYSGRCPASPITLYNLLGQVINRFDPATGWFERRTMLEQRSAMFSASMDSDL